MNFRIFILLLTIATLFFCGYWIFSNVPLYALAVRNAEKWDLVANGWGIFTAGWVFAIPCLLISLAVMIPIQLIILQSAKRADHANEIETLKQDCKEKLEKMERTVNSAKNQTENAMEDAKEQYQTLILEAKERTIVANTETKKAKEMQVQAANHAKQCNLSVQKSTQNIQRATKKRDNASAVAERRKRKLERINPKIDSY